VTESTNRLEGKWKAPPRELVSCCRQKEIQKCRCRKFSVVGVLGRETSSRQGMSTCPSDRGPHCRLQAAGTGWRLLPVSPNPRAVLEAIVVLQIRGASTVGDDLGPNDVFQGLGVDSEIVFHVRAQSRNCPLKFL